MDGGLRTGKDAETVLSEGKGRNNRKGRSLPHAEHRDGITKRLVLAVSFESVYPPLETDVTWMIYT